MSPASLPAGKVGAGDPARLRGRSLHCCAGHIRFITPLAGDGRWHSGAAKAR
ncbi:MAG: hypothetical protein MUF81_09765 [Verrucomicrobia bacterium]|nr:hypothetical protein [Verrucomicrobiota bacterium]